MQLKKSPKTLFIVFSIITTCLFSSCTKEHDLISTYVVAETQQAQKVATSAIDVASLSDAKQSHHQPAHINR